MAEERELEKQSDLNSEQSGKHHTRASFSVQAIDNKSSWHLLNSTTLISFYRPKHLAFTRCWL